MKRGIHSQIKRAGARGTATVAKYPRRSVWLVFALFFAGPPLAAQSISSPPTADEVTLRPGDVLNVRVWRRPELSGDFVIAADGAVGDPFYADVRVAGLSAAEARQRIRNHVSRIEAEPLVWVEPVFRVAVTGQVRQPNLYPVRYPTTVGEAIAQAGGPTELAQLDRVQFIRNGASQTGDLRDPGSALARTVLMSGDEIRIPRRSTTFRDSLAPISTLASIAALIVTITTR